MEQAAFAPKAGFDDPDALGTICVSDNTEINVREAVEAGGGTIITDDPRVIAALDNYAALKRVSVSSAEDTKEKSSRKKATKDEDD
jgi:hypothetical protein